MAGEKVAEGERGRGMVLRSGERQSKEGRARKGRERVRSSTSGEVETGVKKWRFGAKGQRGRKRRVGCDDG